MNFKELKEQYNQSLKSMDTEEHIDLWFYRPLGFAWATLFAKLGISPNIVTIASIFLGVGGGILLYFGAQPYIWLNYVGIFLIIWANTYDSADGQLARLTKQYSQIGRILDGVSGDLWFFAIYFALVFRELHFGDEPTKFIRLAGLPEDAMYRREEDGALFSGAALMDTGIPLPHEGYSGRIYRALIPVFCGDGFDISAFLLGGCS